MSWFVKAAVAKRTFLAFASQKTNITQEILGQENLVSVTRDKIWEGIFSFFFPPISEVILLFD